MLAVIRLNATWLSLLLLLFCLLESEELVKKLLHKMLLFEAV